MDSWGDGLSVSGSGFAAGTPVNVQLTDSGVIVAQTTFIADGIGSFELLGWLPDRFTLSPTQAPTYPHLSAPGAGITVVADSVLSDGTTVAADGVPVNIASPAPAGRLTQSLDMTPLADGAEAEMGGVRFMGTTAHFEGFALDEPVGVGLTAPDGSVSQPSTVIAFPLFGIVQARIGLDLPAQLGRFTATATGTQSGRRASVSLVVVASAAPGIYIYPRVSAGAGADPDPTVDSGGALWGFVAHERVSLGFFTTAGAPLAPAAGTPVSVRVDAVGWSPLHLGGNPLVNQGNGIYCVVALGTSSGRAIATAFAYSDDFIELRDRLDNLDCSAAIAAAKKVEGGGTASPGTGDLAATGSAPGGVTLLAGVCILLGLALVRAARGRHAASN